MIVSSRIKELSPFLSKVTLSSFCSTLKHLLKTGCTDHILFSIIKGHVSHAGEKFCWGFCGAGFPLTLISGCSLDSALISKFWAISFQDCFKWNLSPGVYGDIIYIVRQCKCAASFILSGSKKKIRFYTISRICGEGNLPTGLFWSCL